MVAASLVVAVFLWEALTYTYHAWLGALLLLAGFLGLVASIIAAAVSCAISLAFLVRRWRSTDLRAAWPLFVLVVAALVSLGMPSAVRDGYLLARQGSFQRVVTDIRAGRLVPLESGLLALPKEYRLPSTGANQVLVSGEGDTLEVKFLAVPWAAWRVTCTRSRNRPSLAATQTAST